MAYRTLYRAFRPKRFEDVLGQEHITTILKNQVAAGRTSHAYVFSGTRGTGKTTTARILARAVNCLSPEDGEPCGKCEACLKTANGSVDIIEMDAASNTGVDDVRALIDKSRYTPLELKMKVYIIDEAHELSRSAFDALLKTLEEPPEHIMFILATTETRKLPATILSRCQRFDFHRIGNDDMVKCVSSAAAGVGATIERDGLLAIARASDGGMRDALTLAEQCISFCGNNVTTADVISVMGGMDETRLFEMSDALLLGDAGRALSMLAAALDMGRDINIFAEDLSRHFRALIMAKLCGDCSSILGCSAETMKKYIASSENVGSETLLRASELLMKAAADMRYIPLPRARLECALVRICFPEDEATQTPALLLERMEKLERKLDAAEKALAERPASAAPHAGVKPRSEEGNEKAPEATPAPEESETPAAPEAPRTVAKAVPSPSAGGEDGMALWLEAAASFSNKSLTALAKRASGATLEGNTLRVTFDGKNKIIFEAFSKSKEAASAVARAREGVSVAFAIASADTFEESVRRAFGDDVEIIDSGD